MHSQIFSIIFAIIMFGVLIFVHELGHFLVAKACGVQVNEFSLGMGPTILKRQGKETLYSLRLFPIGGFCAMEGEDEDSSNPRAFSSQRGWKRFLILVAGAAMNFLMGLLILLGLYAGVSAFPTTTIESMEPGCSAEGYLQPGDTILSVDGARLLVYSDFSTALSRGNGQTADLVIRRDGEKLRLEDVPMYTQEFETEDGTVVRYGFVFAVQKATIPGRISYALRESVDFVRMIWYSLEDLFTGAVGLRDLSGPIGIVSTMSEVGQASSTWGDALVNLLYFAAFIAINLAVMNLLPIPALDGGRVFFLVVNGLIWLVARRKIDPKYEGYVHGAGLVLLLLLMLVVAASDVFRLIGF